MGKSKPRPQSVSTSHETIEPHLGKDVIKFFLVILFTINNCTLALYLIPPLFNSLYQMVTTGFCINWSNVFGYNFRRADILWSCGGYQNFKNGGMGGGGGEGWPYCKLWSGIQTRNSMLDSVLKLNSTKLKNFSLIWSFEIALRSEFNRLIVNPILWDLTILWYWRLKSLR